MCEFKVFLDGEEVFRDVVYAKAENGKVTVKDVIGESREFENCRIVEVDVNNTKLVLSKA
ncbi:CooT family nickel-binding protein [Candidatus Bathyarchaeota archaeon]|nr:CooT family nickel-binding protein [Candidatus Bathyarchaeota archaeon]